MTRRTADKILQGLRDVIEGNFARATFIGIDWGRKDFTACRCPRCTTNHRWRKRTPKHCRHCGLEFKFTSNESAEQAARYPQESTSD